MITLLSPTTGRTVNMANVPDPVFAEKMLGDGIAIEPSLGEIRAPIDGVVKALFPTGHAVGILTADGVEILIHIGIESVKYPELFEAVVTQGKEVKAGDLLIRFDLEGLRQKAASSITPMVITVLPEGMTMQSGPAAQSVKAGVDSIITLQAG
jgi:PTS system glucose-specific IIA component